MNLKQFCYETNCTDERSGEEVSLMVDGGKEVTYETLSRRVANWDQFCLDMGYALNKRDGLTMKNDYHVRYHKGHFRGARCYYVVHSAIEWIFTVPSERSPTAPPRSIHAARPFGIEASP